MIGLIFEALTFDGVFVNEVFVLVLVMNDARILLPLFTCCRY